jgi:hypothetical protein
VVFDRKGRFLAVGLLDPDGPIRLRILSAGTPAQIGGAFFRERLQGALALRAPLLADPRTTGLRLLSGENDGMPGLVVDRYGETLVLKAYTLAWSAHLRELLPVLVELCGPRAVLLLAARRVAGSPLAPPFLREPALLHGTLPVRGMTAARPAPFPSWSPGFASRLIPSRDTRPGSIWTSGKIGPGWKPGSGRGSGASATAGLPASGS